MKKRIVLLIVLGVMQGSLQIKASESDVESNCSESFIGVSLNPHLKARIDEWMNKLTDLTNQNHSLNEYNRNLSEQLEAHKRFHQYAKWLVWQQNNKIKQLEARLEKREQLIDHQRHTIQQFSIKQIESPSFP